MIGLVVTVCMVLLLSGCGERNSALQPDKQSIGYEVTDSQGYKTKFQKKPQRIVTLTLAADEILLSLVPLERIAALTYLVDDPGISNVTQEAKGIGRRVKAHPEEIIALQPDVLIIADWQPVELIQTIREAGIAVYVYKTPKTIIEVQQVVQEIAQVVGEEEAGRKLVGQMEEQLANLARTIEKITPAERKTVVRFTLMGGTGGKGSLFDDICQYAGVVNGASKVGVGMHEIMSKEKVVQANPDILIMPMWDYNGKNNIDQFKQETQDDPAFQSITAIEKQQLFMIPDRHLSCSSQHVVKGVMDIAKVAYNKIE